MHWVFYDDWRKVVYKDPNGVSAKFKMVWQTLVAIGAGFALFYMAKNGTNNILNCAIFQTSGVAIGRGGFHDFELSHYCWYV